MENCRFAVLRPLGGLEAASDVHLKLIGKHILDFLLVLIELFSLGVTAEALRANIGSKYTTNGFLPGLWQSGWTPLRNSSLPRRTELKKRRDKWTDRRKGKEGRERENTCEIIFWLQPWPLINILSCSQCTSLCAR